MVGSSEVGFEIASPIDRPSKELEAAMLPKSILLRPITILVVTQWPNNPLGIADRSKLQPQLITVALRKSSY